MTETRKPITVLMADDDHDDCLLAKDAWKECRVLNPLVFVHDGEELMDYLHQRGQYAAPGSAPRPGLILLDLNMPRKDGREALKEIKGDPKLRRIPVVVLTTSKAEEDIYRTYDLGVNSYISKPVTFTATIAALKTMTEYWIELVSLPAD